MILSALFFGLSAYAAATTDFLADLELFRARSLGIQSEQAQLKADAKNTLSRLLQFTPQLSAGVGKQWAASQEPLPPAGTYGRLSADWNLFRGGSDYFSWRASRSAEEAQKFAVLSEELQTELKGAALIFRRLYLRDVAGAQAELLNLKLEALRIGKDRFQQGKIPLQDVSKIEVDLSQQQNSVRRSEIDLAENEAAYRAFFVDELKTREWPLASGQLLSIPEKSEGSMDQRRLDLRARSLNEGWLASRMRHLPAVDFRLSYLKSPLKQPAENAWSGTIEISVPLWSRFELVAADAQAYASFERAENEAARHAREEEARRDFIRQKISLSQKNLEDARLNLEKSNRLYRDMLRSFQLGRLSTNDLFLEQDRKIRALLSYSESRLSYHESLMEACVLFGQYARQCLRR